MKPVLAVSWQLLRGVLPYPDLWRRWRVDRRAHKLITCRLWPGDEATGMDAAQLALLRLLWLQRLTRNAVSMRRDEDAALLARASIETCIVGLYCVQSGDAIAHLSAPSYGAAGPVPYLINADLGSRAAIDSAVVALGEIGPDLNIRDLALWLEREHGLVLATGLYHRYYVPLSHLFAHSYAFSLMRHVRPGGTLHRRPDFPWIRRSAARMADGCAAVLAASIADKAGVPSALFHRSATAHLDRLLTPALVFAVKGAFRSGPWREFPRKLQSIIEAQRSAGPSGRGHDADREDGGTADALASFLDPAASYARGGVYSQNGDEHAGATDQAAGDERRARHRR
jgi:hypothetical protein